MADINELLGKWREEIEAEAQALRAEVSEQRAGLAAAEIADRTERAYQRALRARFDDGPLANVLALRLEAAMKDATSGPVVRLRGKIAELERRIADCLDALEQLDRALAPPAIPSPEDSRFIVAGLDQPRPEDVVTEFRGGRAA